MKDKRVIRQVLTIYLVCVVARIFEYFVLRTDQTILGEAFIHKLFGIIVICLVVRRSGETLSDIGFVKNDYIRSAVKGLALGLSMFAIGYFVEILILMQNRTYAGIGNLVQGKQTTPNHKVKKTIIKEKCEWIRIEKNHEPVITDRDFEVVQRLLAMDTRTSPDREEVYPLSGVVTCGGCGIPMVRKTSKVGGKTYAYYLCATHKDSKQCSSHRISTDKLEEVVLELLQTHIDNMIDLKRILSFIGNVPFQQLDMKKLEERREKKQAEVDRCADLRGMLYEDMKDGIISKEDYKELHTAYEQRKKSAEIAIHQIELEMEDVLNRKSKGFVWLDYFTEHKNIEKLTREVVVSLIREIKVFDKTHIEVVFDFDDCYKECLNVIASQGHSVEVDSTGKLNIRLKEAV